MKSNHIQMITALAGLFVPLLMLLPTIDWSVYINLPSLLFLLGAAGVLQTFFSSQSLPIASFRRLQEPSEKVDFHHICASAALFGGCIPGLVLAYSLYSHVNEPGFLGPILAVILLTLLYSLALYLLHFGTMVTQPGAHIDVEREASWLKEHHFQLRQVLLFTSGIVACTIVILLMSFMKPGQDVGMEGFRDGQIWVQAIHAAQELIWIVLDYRALPWWILQAVVFYKLMRFSRDRLGFVAVNNPWILSNLILVCGPIFAIFILIYQLSTAYTPYGFVLPIAPVGVLVLSWIVSMWLSRNVRRQKPPRFQVQTNFASSPVWTRVFQVVCLGTIAYALSVGGFEALMESFLTIGFLCLFGIYSLSRQRKLESLVSRRTQELRLANERNESLLHNVLPVSIAERLKKEEEGVIADDHHQVSILFADIAGFTAMSSEMTSGDLVRLLSSVFARFDTLAEKHRIEKIKTIGDAYMVASGVPIERSDHAHALAAFALDMQSELKAIAKELNRELDIRIGIHSGPVTAGVIGTQKFAYDLWGDTVNTASRMESNGKVGSIQISEETKNLLEGAFTMEERGKVAMKGKGELMTYFLLGSAESS